MSYPDLSYWVEHEPIQYCPKFKLEVQFWTHCLRFNPAFVYAYCRRHPHLRTGLSMSSSYICPLVHIQRGFLLQYLYEVDNNKNNVVRISVLQTLLVKFISSFHALIILNYLNVHLSSVILPRFLTFTQISVKSTEYKDGEDSTFYSVDLKRDYSYCIKFIGKKNLPYFQCGWI